MSVDGFEDEILALMKRMDQRMRGNTFNSGIKKKKKKRQVLGLDLREPCKLECSINYSFALAKEGEWE